MTNIFPIRLKALRKQAGKTQDEMSKALEIQRSTYGEYERGRIMPSADRLKALANYFNVPTDYLLGKTNFTEQLHEVVHAGFDIMDMSVTMKFMLDQLCNNNNVVKFEGVDMNQTAREILISNIENAIKMTEMVIKNHK